MAAKITYQITENNFELIRDKIATILKEELSNQANIQSDPDLDPDIYVERFTPVDKEEEKVLVVTVDRWNGDNETTITQKLGTIFNIDIYTFSEGDENNEGYYYSSKKMERLAGLIRHILEHPEYIHLDFSSKFIYRTSVFTFLADDGGRNEDGLSSRMGLIQFRVEHEEQQTPKAPIALAGSDTVFTIEETEKGYKIITNT